MLNLTTYHQISIIFITESSIWYLNEYLFILSKSVRYLNKSIEINELALESVTWTKFLSHDLIKCVAKEVNYAIIEVLCKYIHHVFIIYFNLKSFFYKKMFLWCKQNCHICITTKKKN